MKKRASYKTIDDYNVITAIGEAASDPAATIKAIAAVLGISSKQVIQHSDYEQLFSEYTVYFPLAPGEKLLDPEEEADLTSKWTVLREHEALTIEGEIIPDRRGAEYYLKTDGVWAEGKISVIGKALPEGAVQPDNLTEEQWKEITKQKEAERIASLTPEERAVELKNKLADLADEADHLSRRANIQGNEFDAVAWYQEHKVPIEEEYSL
jgi:hypothetical protein